MTNISRNNNVAAREGVGVLLLLCGTTINQTDEFDTVRAPSLPKSIPPRAPVTTKRDVIAQVKGTFARSRYIIRLPGSLFSKTYVKHWGKKLINTVVSNTCCCPQPTSFFICCVGKRIRSHSLSLSFTCALCRRSSVFGEINSPIVGRVRFPVST